MDIKAIRIDKFTGVKLNVLIEVEVTSGDDGKLWFHITKGGITGYEKASLRSFAIDPSRSDKGWWACRTKEGIVDGLYIPPCQMDILLAEVGL